MSERELLKEAMAMLDASREFPSIEDRADFIERADAFLSRPGVEEAARALLDSDSEWIEDANDPRVYFCGICGASGRKTKAGVWAHGHEGKHTPLCEWSVVRAALSRESLEPRDAAGKASPNEPTAVTPVADSAGVTTGSCPGGSSLPSLEPRMTKPAAPEACPTAPPSPRGDIERAASDNDYADAVAGIVLPDFVEDYIDEYRAICMRDPDRGGGHRARGKVADALRDAIRRAIHDAEQAAIRALPPSKPAGEPGAALPSVEAVVAAAIRIVQAGCFRFKEDDDGHESCGFCSAPYRAKTGGCKHTATCEGVVLKDAVERLVKSRPAPAKGSTGATGEGGNDA